MPAVILGTQQRSSLVFGLPVVAYGKIQLDALRRAGGQMAKHGVIFALLPSLVFVWTHQSQHSVSELKRIGWADTVDYSKTPVYRGSRSRYGRAKTAQRGEKRIACLLFLS